MLRASPDGLGAAEKRWGSNAKNNKGANIIMPWNLHITS